MKALSREIKFRVWNNWTERMYQWVDLENLSNYHYVYQYFRNLHEQGCHIMQYTGLKDRTGKEIYEGDIVTGGVLGEVKPVVIEWGHQVKWEGMADGYNVHHIGFNFNEYYFKLEECEIIGNIYERPHLLTKENK